MCLVVTSDIQKLTDEILKAYPVASQRAGFNADMCAEWIGAYNEAKGKQPDFIPEIKSLIGFVENKRNQDGKSFLYIPESITYTPIGKKQQTYTVIGTHIYNKDGKEVFATDSKDRRRVFANLAVQQGRAVVVENGVFPQGLFAKTVGYLPGDIISVTNIAGDTTIDLLVIGALDPSEGVAIMLSPEAAQAMGIDKGSNNIVKITKRSGQDERVYGNAVISKSSAEIEDWDDSNFDNISAEENTEAFDEAEKEAPAETEEEFTEPEEEAPVESEPAEEEPAEEAAEESVEEPAEELSEEPAEEAEEEPEAEETIEEEAFEDEAPIEEETFEEENIEE